MECTNKIKNAHLPDADRDSHPLLMSELMSAAIRTDDKSRQKTQTRRLMNPQPNGKISSIKCPYGKIGDLIWVKETYYAYGKWEKNGKTKSNRQKWKFIESDSILDGEKEKYLFSDTLSLANSFIKYNRQSSSFPCWHKHPSLFMPKKAARTWLKITNIRIEQLKDISEHDAMKEGIMHTFTIADGLLFVDYLDPKKNDRWNAYPISAKQSYMTLWDYIHGKGSWKQDEDKLVWVIDFKRI